MLDVHKNTHAKSQTFALLLAANPPPALGMVDLYIYSAIGIVAFVVIVIIVSVASMRGCKGEIKVFFSFGIHCYLN